MLTVLIAMILLTTPGYSQGGEGDSGAPTEPVEELVEEGPPEGYEPPAPGEGITLPSEVTGQIQALEDQVTDLSQQVQDLQQTVATMGGPTAVVVSDDAAQQQILFLWVAIAIVAILAISAFVVARKGKI